MDSSFKEKIFSHLLLRFKQPGPLLGTLDLALLLSTFFLIFTRHEIFLILIFFFLTLGAFYWEFRAFVLRAGFWVAVTSVVVLISVLAYEVDAEELIDIPLLTSILVVVFVMARQRKHAEEALRDVNQHLENRVVERTAALTRLNEELVQEVVEHKRTETMLRQREEELRKLSRAVEQSPSIVIITDTQGKIEYVNPRFTQVTGYSLEEVVGKTPRFLKSGETPQAEYHRLWQTISTGGEWQGEFHNRKKNGELYWVSSSISPIRNPDGTITHFLAVQEDITKRKEAELQLERYNQELQTLLRQEQAMRDQLVQAEKFTAMGRMVASVAHELNNPLQTIKNCLFLARQDVLPEDPLYEYLNISTTEIDRLSNLVAQLREVYRPHTAEMVCPLDVGALLQETHTLVTPHLQKHRVQWKQSSPAANFLVEGIADQLKQVFLNISLNAIEAMQPTGGVLSVNMAANENRQVAITFTDTGPGISSENLSKVFEPLFTTKRAGTGLGLSISYDIVRAHGGQITVESQPGKGSSFIVWLPLLNSDAPLSPNGNREPKAEDTSRCMMSPETKDA